MNISFHGAANCVTGSKHLIELDNGQKILLDCGLFQGMGIKTLTLNAEWHFNPKEIQYLIVSHAHIDHIGLIPSLVKQGFKGAIYATPPSIALIKILLIDSANIQGEDVKFLNKRRHRMGLPPVNPLYTIEDVQCVFALLQSVDYNQWFSITPTISFCFSPAGHILGSACINLKMIEKDATIHLTFSGDIGRYTQSLLPPPAPLPFEPNYLILESTYGNREHQMAKNELKETLLDWIKLICLHNTGKLVIPAFSLGRTQELLFALNALELEHRLPKIPYYLDSPLSIEITKVMERFSKYTTAQAILEIDKYPYSFTGLCLTKTVDESKSINFDNRPSVIIASSGMAEAGRIKHHIFNTIENSKNCILMSGYCVPESLGGKLLNGFKEVKIFGMHKQVHATIAKLEGLSAHGDKTDLLHFVDTIQRNKLKKIFLVHGEPKVQDELRKTLEQKFHIPVTIPYLYENLDL